MRGKRRAGKVHGRGKVTTRRAPSKDQRLGSPSRSDVAQNHSQPQARATHPHSRRRHRNSGNGGDLFVREAVNMPQEKGFSLIAREFSERPQHLVADYKAIGKAGRRAGYAIEGDSLKQSPAGAVARGPAAVGEYAEQPRVESLALLITVKRLVYAHERVLNTFFRILAAGEEVPGEAQAARVVRANELGKRRRISFTGSAQRLC